PAWAARTCRTGRGPRSRSTPARLRAAPSPATARTPPCVRRAAGPPNRRPGARCSSRRGGCPAPPHTVPHPLHTWAGQAAAERAPHREEARGRRVRTAPRGKENDPDMSADDSSLVRCPRCGENGAPGARFCENCGTPLGAPAPDAGAPSEVTLGLAPTVVDPDPATGEASNQRPCTACGGTIAPDGYCADCGAPGLSERDHFEERPAGWVAGVCDRGVRHARNEDAMALAAGDSFAALVVCDGVSSAPDSDVASLAASRAARDVLVAYGPQGSSTVQGATSRRVAGWTDAMVAASRAAGQAVRGAAEQLAATKGKDVADDPPSCTFVAAVVDGDVLVAGWLGDSRVYWLPDDGQAEQLSVDDSWAQEMI